jgi:hypothetical protein
MRRQAGLHIGAPWFCRFANSLGRTSVDEALIVCGGKRNQNEWPVARAWFISQNYETGIVVLYCPTEENMFRALSRTPS